MFTYFVILTRTPIWFFFISSISLLKVPMYSFVLRVFAFTSWSTFVIITLKSLS